MRSALALLERASESWQNGDVGSGGPLHWPVAVHFARTELQAALALVERLQARAAQLEAVARLNAETIRGMQAAALEAQP